MESQYVAYIGFATTLIGILVSYFLGKRSALKIHEKQRRQSACDRFRAAIAQEMSLWRRLDTHSPGVIASVNRRLPELENSSIIAALIEFRPFVKKNAEEYEQACKAYEKHKQKVSAEPWEFAGSHPVPVRLLETLLQFGDDKKHKKIL